MLRGIALGMLLTLAATLAVADENGTQAIPPAEAKDHVGQQVTVEMVVKKSKKSVRRKTVYLDSLEDFQDPDNLGIAIDEAGEQDFSRKFNSTDLPALFLGKTIRVTGTVVRRDERTYIDVAKASQIDLVQPNQ